MRSMRGAQFLLAMSARRSRRALSISFRYSVSTTGNAIESAFSLVPASFYSFSASKTRSEQIVLKKKTLDLDLKKQNASSKKDQRYI